MRAMARNLSFLLQYGNYEFFARLLNEGFTEVACGFARRYVEGLRFAAFFAFYRPLGEPQDTDFVQVPTWQVQHRECAVERGEEAYGEPQEVRYSVAALAKYVYRHQIVFGEKMGLREAVTALLEEGVPVADATA
jgi:hypothetical protein